MSALKPIKNYRRIRRRCCANCKYWVLDDIADYKCLRSPDKVIGDWHSNEPEFHVCDRHVWERE